MTDQGILKHIKTLVEEEQALYETDTQEADDRQRLDQLQVELDQCWDLLRQRRALREHGMDPDSAEVRDEETVEGYVN